jgi:D-lactate dehydrogenase
MILNTSLPLRQSTKSRACSEDLYYENLLREETAQLAADCDCICAFVNDNLNANTLGLLAKGKTRLIAMRCAGFNNVDIEAAKSLGISVVRVPAYSPHAVSEHVIAILMALYRTTHRSHNRIREGNFSLEGMVGHEVFGKTVGVIGTGKIGALVARLFLGFGCKVYAFDMQKDQKLVDLGVVYGDLDTLWSDCDIITLHCPLLPQTKHLINEVTLSKMKEGVTIINTSRGGLIDTTAAFTALKSEKIGHLGINVYEEEDNLFFEDLSTEIIQDDLFMRLTTFPNVFITGHQAFFTNTALTNIAETTLSNIAQFEASGSCVNQVFSSQ